MAYKKEMNLEISKFSKRESYIGEHSGTSVEGGALNANYTLVDAVGNVCNQLGKHGYSYGKDFVWGDHAWTENFNDAISIKYNDPKIETLLGIR